MSKNQGMSLNPEDFTEGGGLIDDVNVTFKGVAFEMFDYQGKVSTGVPSLCIVMEDEEEDEHTQYYSMGNAQDWAPSPDGKKLVAVGSATGIRSSSNGAILLKSIVDSGFPTDKIDDDITVFEGMKCHVIRIPAPKRAGIKTKKRDDGKEYEKTILVVDEIISFPWDKAKPKGAPKGKKGTTKSKKATKAKTSESTEDLTGKAKETVLGVVLEAGEVDKKVLPTKVFQVLKNDPDRNAIAKMVFDDDFLSNGDWEYDQESGTLSME